MIPYHKDRCRIHRGLCSDMVPDTPGIGGMYGNPLKSLCAGFVYTPFVYCWDNSVHTIHIIDIPICRTEHRIRRHTISLIRRDPGGVGGYPVK